MLHELVEGPSGTPAADDGPDSTLVDRLMVELTLHEAIEDEIFYPAASNLSTLVPIAHAEHRQMADQLANVLRSRRGSARFRMEAAALRRSVEGHASEEEQVMFPEVEAKLDDPASAALGRALRQRLSELRASRWTSARLRLKRAVIRHTPSWPGAGRP